MLDFSLFGDELRQKVDIAGSFISCVRVLEPRRVATEIKIGNSVDVGAEKDFENQLTDIHFSVFIRTELVHVQNLDRRIVLDDLSEQTDHR